MDVGRGDDVGLQRRKNMRKERKESKEKDKKQREKEIDCVY